MAIDHISELSDDDLGGASGAKHFHVHFVGKTDTSDFPYTVFNEKVAGEIGRVMGLPCPEVLIEPFNDRHYFFSHWQEISKSGMELPPQTATERQTAMAKQLDIMHGMLVFDLYIANNDRKADNIKCRSDGTLSLIDHANALLYYKRSSRSAPHGIDRLEEVSKDIRKMFEDDRHHHFMHLLPEKDALEKWITRMQAVPDHFIGAIVRGCPDTGQITSDWKLKTIEFLIERKKYLSDHIEKHRDFLSRMQGKA